MNKCPVCNQEIASEAMAYKFKDSGKGWPGSLDSYHWPGKSSINN